MCQRLTPSDSLFTNLITDSLTEFSYDADLAGLSYSVSAVSRGIWVSLSGYNDKMAVLARHVLERVKLMKIKPERLEVIKEQVRVILSVGLSPDIFGLQLKRDWENFFFGQTYRLSDYFARYILTEQQWTIEQSLAEMACKYLPPTIIETKPDASCSGDRRGTAELHSRIIG
jgi:insulysin